MNHRLHVKLPVQVVDIDPASGKPIHRYTLLYYLEIFRGGDRHYSQIYTEVVDTGAKATSVQVAAEKACPVFLNLVCQDRRYEVACGTRQLGLPRLTKLT
jgi:hypothetical protein